MQGNRDGGFMLPARLAFSSRVPLCYEPRLSVDNSVEGKQTAVEKLNAKEKMSLLVF